MATLGDKKSDDVKKTVEISVSDQTLLRDSITVRRAQLKRAINKEMLPHLKNYMLEVDSRLEELFRRV